MVLIREYDDPHAAAETKSGLPTDTTRAREQLLYDHRGSVCHADQHAMVSSAVLGRPCFERTHRSREPLGEDRDEGPKEDCVAGHSERRGEHADTCPHVIAEITGIGQSEEPPPDGVRQSKPCGSMRAATTPPPALIAATNTTTALDCLPHTRDEIHDNDHRREREDRRNPDRELPHSDGTGDQDPAANEKLGPRNQQTEPTENRE